MKIGFIGDLHLQSSKPVSRLDTDWLETIKEKLTFVNNLDVDMIVCTGDIVTQRPLTVATLLFVQDVLSSTITKPFYSIVGNHDQVTSTVSILRLIPQIRYLTLLEIDDVVIHGVDYGQSIPEPILQRYNIYVTHELLTPVGKELPGAYHVPRIKKHQLLIAGHYHEPFVNEEYRVINPGVVFRCRYDEKNVQSFVVVFDTTSGKYELVPLPQRKDVFKKRESGFSDIESLVQSLKSISFSEEEDLFYNAPDHLKPLLLEYKTRVK